MTNAQIGEENSDSSPEIIISDEQINGSQDDDTGSQEERDSREESRFKDGQILRFVRVRFPGNSRSFPFLVGKRKIEYGQKVVAMSDRGMAVGYVNSFPYDIPFNKSMLPVRSIAKIAGQEDFERDQEAYRQQKHAENICNELIERYQLDMYLTHVEFTSFGKKAVFYFIAPARVDFRELVKDLVGRLKTRIELRQISVRDRSAAIGGIGPCGRELCCSSFLTKYGNAGVKMAKNQDLTLNFSKLNGVCGQLKCCLQYEDDVYRDKRAKLPKEGDIILTHTGEIGRVDRLHLLSEQFVMMTNRGVRKRYVVDLFKETLNKDEANFPREFESVSDETFKVIGLDESKAKKVKAFEEEIKAHKSLAKSFAEKSFENLFGEKTLGNDLPELKEPEGTNKKIILTPDEEEEISYTPPEEELLLDDEEEFNYNNSDPVISRGQLREDRERQPGRFASEAGRNNQSNSRNRPHDARPSRHRDQRDQRSSRDQRQGHPRHDNSGRNQPPRGNRPPR